MENNLTPFNLNMLLGTCFAVFSVLIGNKITTTELRDFILIVTLAILATTSIIEQWFSNSSMVSTCLIGFSVGFVADDVYLNLKATLPKFIKTLIQDIFEGVKMKVKVFLGLDKDKGGS